MFVTVTFTEPVGWAGVFAVILMELTTTTFVAAVPPKVTLAPLAKPVPLMVTAVPPAAMPLAGLIEFTITGARTTFTLMDVEMLQPLLALTVSLSVSVPGPAAVKVTLLVPEPAVIVPPVMLQAYVAPAPAFATEAALPVEPLTMLAGAVMFALGVGLTVTTVVADGALVQPPAVTVTV